MHVRHNIVLEGGAVVAVCVGRGVCGGRRVQRAGTQRKESARSCSNSVAYLLLAIASALGVGGVRRIARSLRGDFKESNRRPEQTGGQSCPHRPMQKVCVFFFFQAECIK